MKFADRVRQTAAFTGASTLTLGVAAAKHRTLAQAIADGAADPEAIKVGDTSCFWMENDAGKWQVALCTVSSGTELVITSVLSSSNAGAAETFNGPVAVACDAPAAILGRMMSSRSIPFSQSIPLTQSGQNYMPQTAVGGALTFTPAANAVRGALVYLRLVADGTNIPSFAAFKEWGGSSGYDNRNGIVNEVQFFYDGYDCWFSASQAVGATPVDATSPTAASAMASNAAPSVVVITTSEVLDGAYVPAATAFAVSGHTVSSVAISGAAISLTVSAAFSNGEAARTISYTQPGSNGVRDVAGNLMASFTGLAVTNNVNPADTTPPAFSSAQVTNFAPTTIAVTLSEPLANIIPPASAFTVSGGKTVSSASISGNVLSLTCSAPYANGDTITMQYTKPGSGNVLQDVAGNAAASFGPSAVTNNVAAAVAALRMGSLVRVAESGAGPYTYVGAAAGGFGGTPAEGDSIMTTVFQSGVDGSVVMKLLSTPTNGGDEVLFGLDASNGAIGYVALDYGIVGHATAYDFFTSGSFTANSVVNGAPNDYIRFTRTGSTLVAEVSKNSGSTWTTIKTWTGVSTGVMYFHALVAKSGSFTPISATGLA